MALGTVQLGMDYGINNLSGRPDDEEINKIFDSAAEGGITILDTAPAYSNAENLIGLFGKNRFRVVTKFGHSGGPASPRVSIRESLQALRMSCVFSLLAHNADLILENHRIWQELKNLRSEGIVQNIGYSVYSTEQLVRLFDKGCIPDTVQLPYSLLDRKFEKWLPLLSESGCLIHARSVFLQGLYHVPLENLPAKLLSLKPSLERLHTLCADIGIKLPQAALAFVARNLHVNNIVLGVDNDRQLKENIEMFENCTLPDNFLPELEKITVENPSILNPANW
jgi:aryl-alcohol dehydrogenase-like predicted oxidoreductase